MVSSSIGDSGHTSLKDHESLELHTASADNRDQKRPTGVITSPETHSKPTSRHLRCHHENSDLLQILSNLLGYTCRVVSIFLSWLREWRKESTPYSLRRTAVGRHFYSPSWETQLWIFGISSWSPVRGSILHSLGNQDMAISTGTFRV